ncbi:MAG: Hsp20/alpha crystallin family protein [Parabacteroides sp.]|jgi:HSP20 family protein|nr:Hsp20/alpha crystallin family protein [Parabacteroides sp.]
MTPMRRNQNWLPFVFNDLFDNDWMMRANSTAPAINVIESDKEYHVEVAAPGMTKNDFNIRIDENDNLVVSMEKKEEHNDNKKNGRFLRREFSYSKFEQTMVLPENVVKDKIEAKVENGVLSINIPKKTEEEVKKAAKIIEIK